MRTLPFALLALLGVGLTAAGQAAVKNVVLVHGAFADGSGWQPVADVLKHDGYRVFVVQEPETTFEADVAATRLVLDRAGPCVLVGHSYGGMVITEAGVHASVKSLVYVAAFQPEVGESAAALNDKKPAAATSIAPVGGGYLQVKEQSFPEDFAAEFQKLWPVSWRSRKCRSRSKPFRPRRLLPRGQRNPAMRWWPSRIA
jgi:pimeloyl-ACP methyl ester carboxylesterase